MRGFIALLVILALLFIALPVAANSSHSYTITHDIDLQLDGDFTFNSTVVTPAQGNVDIGLDGVGVAHLKSNLAIIDVTKVSSAWYDLF